jgi:hypothetical protein
MFIYGISQHSAVMSDKMVWLLFSGGQQEQPARRVGPVSGGGEADPHPVPLPEHQASGQCWPSQAVTPDRREYI